METASLVIHILYVHCGKKFFFSKNIGKYEEENLNEVGFHSLLTFWDLIFKVYY